MAARYPPTYDEAIGADDDDGRYGTREDLAFAESLVKNLTVFAALRPSDDAADLSRSLPFLLFPPALVCFPCFLFGIASNKANLDNTVYIVTNKSVVVAVADHDVVPGCNDCRSGKDYLEIPFEGITSINVDNRGRGCTCCVVPSVHLMLVGRDVYLFVEHPDVVADLIRRLKSVPSAPPTQPVVVLQPPQHQLQQQQPQPLYEQPNYQQPHYEQLQLQAIERRIFVAVAGSTEGFSIVQLKGNTDYDWDTFLEEIRHLFGIKKGLEIRITLEGVNARVTSPKQLQANDKILVQTFL